MKVLLGENDFLGKGNNNQVYYYPGDKGKCIKIPLNTGTKRFMKYELQYRKCHKEKVEKSTLLTKYYGMIETNLGIGYVFELVRDFNGRCSKTLESFIMDEKDSSEILEVLKVLKTKIFEESNITNPLSPNNCLIQRISEQKFRPRIIDDIGMHVLIPIPYYFNSIARRREEKIWKNFVNLLHNQYGFEGYV